MSRQASYVSIGFKAENVLIHPDNAMEASQHKKYGVICLGVPIGDKQYIQERLEEKLVSLRCEGEKLVDYRGTTQSKLLMLRYSFAQKVTHLLRCIPPAISGQFALAFNDLKIELFTKILEVDKSTLTTMHKEQIFTHIRDGGFGVGNAVTTAPAAFAASYVSAMDVLAHTFPNLEKDIQVEWLISQSGKTQDEVFGQWLDLASIKNLAKENSYFSHCIDALKQLHKLSGKAPNLCHLFNREEVSTSKLQKVLFRPCREKHLQHMMKDWPLNKDIQRYLSCIGNREEASAWLEAFPTSEFELLDPDFRIACILRLGIPFPEIVRISAERGSKNHHKCYPCSKSKSADGVQFDDFGHHFAHGCLCGGGRNRTHNVVRDAAFQMYRELGMSAEREVTLAPLSDAQDPNAIPILETEDLLLNDEEDEEENENNDELNTSAISTTSVAVLDGPQAFEIPAKPKHLRADIVLHDSPFTIVEISVTNPCLGIPTDQTSAQSMKAKNSAEARSKSKITKYKKHNIVDDSGRRRIQPFVVEIFGRMDPVIYNSIRDLSRKVIGKGYAAVQFRTYWFQRISCALQRMHATSFKRNLAIARNEIKPGSLGVSTLVYESMGYANAGSAYSFSSGAGRCSDF